MTLRDYGEQIVASGFPGLARLGPRARGFQLDSYLRSVVNKDVPDQGLAIRKPESLLSGQGRPLRPESATLLGVLFEALATMCVRVPAQAAETEVSHMRMGTTRST